MKELVLLLLLILAISIAIYLFRKLFERVVVYEFEKGLLYRKGCLVKTLGPGLYWVNTNRSVVQKVDMRLQTVSVPGQEVLCHDNIAVKISLALQYSVVDPAVAKTKIAQYQEALYMSAQLALRQLVGEVKADELITKRRELGALLHEQLLPSAKEYGLEVKTVDLKDMTFPGDIKKIFSQVVKAQKEGLALLEKARGETAALRNLANAAKMLEDNPVLLQLRMLQTVESGTGNSVVLGWPDKGVPLPVKGDPAEGRTAEAEG
jgi:regulator of protease activity HflC (stomatin/prohibitin superfamily)